MRAIDLHMRPPTRIDIAVVHAQAQHAGDCSCHLCSGPCASRTPEEGRELVKAAVAAGVLPRLRWGPRAS